MTTSPQDGRMLEPCPFCGATNLVKAQPHQRIDLTEYTRVHCGRCDAEGPVSFDYDWNTRQSPTATGQAAETIAPPDYKPRAPGDPLRRCDLWSMTPAELAIHHAVGVVEAVGADVRLTDAIVLLGRARDAVADYVDGVPRKEPIGVVIATDQAAETIAAQAKQIDVMESSNRQCGHTIDNQCRTIRDLRSERDRLRDEVAKWKRDWERVVSDNDRLRSEVAAQCDLLAREENLEHERDAAQAELGRLRDEIATLKYTCESITATSERRGEECARLETELARVRDIDTARARIAENDGTYQYGLMSCKGFGFRDGNEIDARTSAEDSVMSGEIPECAVYRCQRIATLKRTVRWDDAAGTVTGTQRGGET